MCWVSPEFHLLPKAVAVADDSKNTLSKTASLCPVDFICGS